MRLTHKDTYEPKKKNSKIKIFFFLFFLLVLSVIFYSAYSDFSITGSAISQGNENKTNLIFISTDLSKIPEISLDGEFNLVKINGEGPSFYVGDENFLLSHFDNVLILDNYDGKISFNKDELTLRGYSEHVSVNSVPVKHQERDTLKVSIKDSFSYNQLVISENVHLKSLEIQTSGVLKFGENHRPIELNNEELIIKKFEGDLSVIDGRFILEGYVESLEIKGEHDISISV